MDYKQKYKAALEWMRDVYPTLTGASKEDAEHFFPELAESEDEKIRKGIIEIIKAVSGQDCDVYLDEKKQEECITWLEKQKEQKPIEPSDDEQKKLLKQIRKHLKETGAIRITIPRFEADELTLILPHFPDLVE